MRDYGSMFGPKLSSLFVNRWFALIWAAMICWMAVDFTSPDSDPNQSAADEKAAAAALGYNQSDISDMQNKLQSW
jgi:hypothetical protein